MPHILGLTGNIATGKSTIGKMLLDFGAHTYIDADRVVHDLYLPGSPLLSPLTDRFGMDILATDGGIDRKKLGAIVFADPSALRYLEQLTHPAVGVAIGERLQAIPADAVAVVDAVKLLEGSLWRICEEVWLVVCHAAEQRRRLIEDRHMTADEAASRLAAQPDRSAVDERISVTIDNSGTLEETRQQVHAAWERYRGTR